jgi:tetratricopeptide (TPR) repeat protein
MTPRARPPRAGRWPLVALLAALASLAPPSRTEAARDRNLVGDSARAARLLGESQIDAARSIIADLAARAAGEPEVRWLTAELAFRDGRYDAALAGLDGLADDALGGSVGHTRMLASRAARVTTGFVSAPSAGGHFVIQHAPGLDGTIAALAGEVLEAARTELLAQLGHAPSAPVRVELLGAPADLAQLSTLTEAEIETTGTIALSKYGKLMVVSPRATLAGYPWMDTLAHEYIHLVVSELGHDAVPVWLQEGLARFGQTRWREPARPTAADLLPPGERAILVAAARKDKLVPLADMHPSLAKLPSQAQAALAYAEVLTLVGWIHARVGDAGLRKIIEAHATGAATFETIGGVVGLRWPEIESQWKASLRSLDAGGRAGARSIQFARGGRDADQAGLAEIADPKARQWARLGGMLRARGHGAAAVVEYRKAHAADPADTLVTGKLARTLVEAGQLDEAIALATPLLTSEPDDPVPAITIGAAELARSQPAAAAAALTQALRVNPFDPTVRCGLAAAYGAMGDARADREQRACAELRAQAP